MIKIAITTVLAIAKNRHKGVEQPEAISYSDGTGRFYALGMGYRFLKMKNK